MPDLHSDQTDFDDLLAANAEYAENFVYGGFDGLAHAGVGIVTCMDSRIPPLQMIGLKPGDAKVLRSAGGRVTELTMTGLVLGVQLLGVRRILIVPHTRCAMAGVTEEELRERVEKAADGDLRPADRPGDRRRRLHVRRRLRPPHPAGLRPRVEARRTSGDLVDTRP